MFDPNVRASVPLGSVASMPLDTCSGFVAGQGWRREMSGEIIPGCRRLGDIVRLRRSSELLLFATGPDSTTAPHEPVGIEPRTTLLPRG